MIETTKQTLAVGATNAQFQMSLTLAGRYNLDPFLREIWCAQTRGQFTDMTSRDGYLKIAQRDPNGTAPRTYACLRSIPSRGSSAVAGYQRRPIANSLPGEHSRLIASTAATRGQATSADSASRRGSKKRSRTDASKAPVRASRCRTAASAPAGLRSAAPAPPADRPPPSRRGSETASTAPLSNQTLPDTQFAKIAKIRLPVTNFG